MVATLADPVTFSPAALRAARSFSGLSLADLGRRVGLIRQHVHHFETGERRPSSEQVSQLARELGVLPAFFEQQVSATRVTDRQLFFRKLAATTGRDRERARAGVEMVHQLIRRLSRDVAFPRIELPLVKATTNEQVERAALACREALGLGPDAPVLNLVRAIEHAGIFVVDLRCGGREIDAFCAMTDPPTIVRNPAKASTSRQRWDGGHELGHHVLHAGEPPGDERQEEQAHRFAGAFLFPKAAFKREFPTTDRIWPHLFALKARWGMSVQAIVKRAHDLELLGDGAYRRMVVYMSRAGWRRKAEPEEPSAEHPELLIAAFEALHELHGTRPQEVLAEIGWPEPMFGRLVGDVVAGRVLTIGGAPLRLVVPRTSDKPDLRARNP